MDGDRDPAGGEQVAQAQDALETVRDTWMQIPEVNGLMVGLLRDADEQASGAVGLIVVAAAEAVSEVQAQLPDEVGGVPVQVRPGAPAPEEA